VHVLKGHSEIEVEMMRDSLQFCLVSVLVAIALPGMCACADDVNGNGARLYLETAEYWSGTAQANGNGAALISVGSGDEGGIQLNGSGGRLTINPLNVLSGTESEMAAARFTAKPTLGEAPLTVHFQNESTGGAKAILTYAWDFGDGEVGNEIHPVHVYQKTGSFSVKLTIITATETASITKSSMVTAAEQVPLAAVPGLAGLAAILGLLAVRLLRRTSFRQR
jgi:PKD repeat protein